PTPSPHISSLSLHDALPICHMPLTPSGDFGSKDFDGSGVRKIHAHTFPAANTGLPFLLAQDSPEKAAHADGFRHAVKLHAYFLQDRKSTRLNSSHGSISYAV